MTGKSTTSAVQKSTNVSSIKIEGTAECSAILKTFDIFVGNDLYPIALRSNSKIPIQKAWNENWDEKSNRDLLKGVAGANIGLLLGKVIDVEGDTKKANQIVNRLIGDYPHPCYRSRKSIHHLFLNPDPELRIITHKGIEFRGFGHQSVLPPSQIDDVNYGWIHLAFPIPEMPETLRSFFDNLRLKRKKAKALIKPEHMFVACAACRKKRFIHKRRFQLELIAFRELDTAWTCQDCRTVDLRDRCRQIRRVLKNNTQIHDWRDWKKEFS